ncbi:MAG: hypothetical protein ACI97A_003234 [Planctomycetota bacterium]|jgi:hypothetical protein
MHPMFLQGGSVASRLRGVNSRFKSSTGGLDTNVAIYALALMVSVLLVILARRVVLWHRWVKLAGPLGFGLDKKALKSWWGYLTADQRQDPEKIFSSKERIATELERLVAADEGKLARSIHERWVQRQPDVKNPLSGIKNLKQAEMILVRDDQGKLILEGFLRRVGTDSIDLVPFRRTSLGEAGLGKGQVHIDRNAGCDSIDAKVLKATADGRLWTFNIGVAAKVDYVRQEFRIKVQLDAMIFDKRQSTLAGIKTDMDTTVVPTHHLLAKQQRERTVTFADLMRRKRMFISARRCQLVDLSALGARICIQGNEIELRESQPLYLFLPFVINSQVEQYLIQANVVEVWDEVTATSDESRMVRMRFESLEDAELLALRRLINVLNATSEDNIYSDAQEICREYEYSDIN